MVNLRQQKSHLNAEIQQAGRSLGELSDQKDLLNLRPILGGLFFGSRCFFPMKVGAKICEGDRWANFFSSDQRENRIMPPRKSVMFWNNLPLKEIQIGNSPEKHTNVPWKILGLENDHYAFPFEGMLLSIGDIRPFFVFGGVFNSNLELTWTRTTWVDSPKKY